MGRAVERSGGCVACYKDEGSGLEQFIRDSLRGYGLRAETETLRLLAHQLSGDRQIILNELEKLSLYVGDEAEWSRSRMCWPRRARITTVALTS